MSIDDLQKVVNIVKSMFSFLIPSKRECLVKDELGRSFYVIETKLYPTSNFQKDDLHPRKVGVYLVHDIANHKVYTYWKQ